MGKQGVRVSDGRFSGIRVNVESVPRLPTFPARWVLGDPRQRPYFVFWTTDHGDLEYALKMAPSDDGAAVLVTVEDGETHRIEILRRPLPRRGGAALFYRCHGCRRPCRYLYRLSLVGNTVTRRLGLRCQACAGLRFASQGSYISPWTRIPGVPLPREPWDPRAVSDPRMVLNEFPGLLKGADLTRAHRFRRRPRDPPLPC